MPLDPRSQEYAISAIHLNQAMKSAASARLDIQEKLEVLVLADLEGSGQHRTELLRDAVEKSRKRLSPATRAVNRRLGALLLLLGGSSIGDFPAQVETDFEAMFTGFCERGLLTASGAGLDVSQCLRRGGYRYALETFGVAFDSLVVDTVAFVSKVRRFLGGARPGELTEVLTQADHPRHHLSYVDEQAKLIATAQYVEQFLLATGLFVRHVANMNRK